MTQRSGLALAVLALLLEGPMHPYRMQQLIRERGKDEVVNVGQRSQLYKTIDRLVRDGLIEQRSTEREPSRPERTTYAVTAAGERTAADWTEDMLRAPRSDFPEFVAALAYLPVITPEVALEAVQARLSDLRARVTALRADHERAATWLPRVVLVESEYLIAHLDSDITWIAALADDLRSGALSWSREELESFLETVDRTNDP